LKRARPSRELPAALTIAGSDSGGGAGIQADLKTFAALGVHGTCAITCLTAQNPRSVSAIQPCPPKALRAQIEAVFAELPPAAIKTGMLYSGELIRAVVQTLADFEQRPLVVDPVMIATSHTSLLKDSALRALTDQLIPLATLVTPNLDEAAVLSGMKQLRSVEDMRRAACLIHSRFACAALVKGGHLRGLKVAVDILHDGKNEVLLSAPFVPYGTTHGTGCTYSAAITAGLARGRSLMKSVSLAKHYITQAIAQSYKVTDHWVLNNCWQILVNSDSLRPVVRTR
jgi:hydroxymethylpyrimidine/phosphomethylpyrimidine kinase